jgi:DNA polymerase III alpha subunit
MIALAIPWCLLILKNVMIQNKFSEMIFSESDVLDLVMQGHDQSVFDSMIVDSSVDLSQWPDWSESMPGFQQQRLHTCSVPEFHSTQQQQWHMPDAYKNMDIAAHVLGLCQSDAELQRCGQELMLYQEQGLFNLLRYLKYLVDVMQQNAIIWGVGRGSSVASHVLYLMGVHRIDSLYYNLDIHEFLR